MANLYVAASKTVQDWAGDVGLGKHVYRVGVTDGDDIERELDGVAGVSDWKVLKSQPWDGDEAAMLERLATKKEKLVDPTYYPKLRGALGVVKVDPHSVENSMLVAFALDNREPPKNFKVKPVDIAQYLLRNLTK